MNFRDILLKSLILLIEATLLAYILTFIIRKIGLDLMSKVIFPIAINIPHPINLIGILLILVGIFLNAWANYFLLVVTKIGLKDREPFHVPSALVFDGPYKYSRNPIYLSVVIMVIGVGILFRSITALFIGFGLYIMFGIWFIRWEEKKLEENFGKEYVDYKSQVRRWI